MKIVIAENHEVARQGLQALLKTLSRDVKFFETDSGDQAYSLIKKHNPDLVILGVTLNNSDGLKTLAKIRIDYDLPIIMYADREIPQYVANSVALSASGYLTKDCSGEELVSSIKKVLAGESLFTREIMRRCTGALATPRSNANTEVPLSKREEEVLILVAHGLTNKEIAASMGISYETVKEHVQHILRKVGVNDRTQAAVWAVRQGIV